MASPIDNIKEAFDGFVEVVNDVAILVNEGPASYPGLYATIKDIHSAILPVGYSLLTLYFLLDFFSKTVNFQFFKWETVVSCCVKLIFAKFIMEHAFDLLDAIFAISAHITNMVGLQGSNANIYVDYDAIEEEYNSLGWFDKKFFAIKLLPFEICIWVIKVVIILVVFGRLFELMIYTAVSPIPISTAINDNLNGTAKRFILDYAAVCLQGIIIIIGCIVYIAISANITLGSFTGNGANMALWKGVLSALALLIVVIKSNSWAKKLTGA
ncbi:hypothetical protein NST44_30920 [Paenibacillus sp. FSL W8-0919]|uniref:hypothetical protein n=1 Tax=Paenibacillus sp. FSL W8-0919 TaxID=2954707 RepID=UPI0030FC6570